MNIYARFRPMDDADFSNDFEGQFNDQYLNLFKFHKIFLFSKTLFLLNLKKAKYERSKKF